MIKNFTKLLTTSLIASAFIFTGCGGETQSVENSASAIKPHKIVRVLEGEDLPSNYADFAAKIEMHAQIVDDKMFLRMEGKDVQTWDMAHMQVYIDIDYDENTGLSMGSGNYAIVGADYMIEDWQLFKSTSSSDWEWELVGYVHDGYNRRGWGSSNSYLVTPATPENNHYFKDVKIDTSLLQGLKKEDGMKIRISMEPINEDWGDTNNYVPAKTVNVVYLEGYQDILDKVGKYNKRIGDDGKYAFGYKISGSGQYLTIYDIEKNRELSGVRFGHKEYSHSIKFVDNETISYIGSYLLKHTIKVSELPFKGAN